MLLHIDVVNKIANYQTRDGCIVCGNSGYQIQFNFDSDWDGVDDKVARFIWNDETRDVPIDSNGLCEVPIVTNTYDVKVGVFSESAGMSTTGAMIACYRSILCD